MNFIEFTWDINEEQILVNVERVLYVLPTEKESVFTLVSGSEESITVKIKKEILYSLLKANAFIQK
jgi:hypothetical protein